jgi:tRNA(Ile)-lysidine synthase
MPLAKTILGPGFDQALARTARRLRQDSQYLDAQGLQLLSLATTAAEGTASCTNDDPAIRLTVDIETLAQAHPAIRTRALHLGAKAAGADAASLNAAQIEALDRLIGAWHGQGAVHLAGEIQARRKCGKLEFRAKPTRYQALKEA